MKLCALLLSLGGMIGGVETVLETQSATDTKPEVAFSQSARLAIPYVAPPESERAIEEALADARNQEGN